MLHLIAIRYQDNITTFCKLQHTSQPFKPEKKNSANLEVNLYNRAKIQTFI